MSDFPVVTVRDMVAVQHRLVAQLEILRLREMFWLEGRLPKEEGLYAYEWHDTPNRRFPSILDFQELCANRGIRILEAIYFNSTNGGV